MVAPIEDLPAPFPLYIFKLLPDLKSVDALRRSSPLFAIVFDLHAAEIFEHLARTTLLDDVAIEIRLYIFSLMRRPWRPRTEGEFNFLYDVAKKPLPRNTPAAAVSRAVRDFSYLHSVGNAILHQKLQRLHRLPHAHLADKCSTSPHSKQPRRHSTPSPYAIRILSDPYWLEEQRIARSLWRLHIFDALENPTESPALHLSNYHGKWSRDELDETTTSVATLKASTGISLSRRPVLSWSSPAAPPPPASAASAGDLAWGNTYERAVNMASRGTKAYYFFHRPCHSTHASPLKDTDWAVLRRLGLGFWTERRMAEELELDNYPRSVKPPVHGRSYKIGVDDYQSTYGLVYTWKSLYLAELAGTETHQAIA